MVPGTTIFAPPAVIVDGTMGVPTVKLEINVGTPVKNMRVGFTRIKSVVVTTNPLLELFPIMRYDDC